MTKITTPRIGLALGGGGARGFAHIPLLEVFDEEGIKPVIISGTSIGSIMGALYASGCSAQDLREIVSSHFFTKGETIADLFNKKNIFKTLEFFDLAWKREGILRGDKIMKFLYDQMHMDCFEDLPIPLKIVTTDYWTGKQVVVEKGPLLPAIKASMGLPGIFAPVEIDGQVLIDGGSVNPVPYDILEEDCDVTIAIDVLGCRKPGKHDKPAVFEAVISTFDIMQQSILREKMNHRPPTHFICPPIQDIDILNFDRSKQVYEQTAPAVEELRAILKSYQISLPSHKDGKIL